MKEKQTLIIKESPKKRAVAQNKKYYVNLEVCINGHKGRRYVSTSACVECAINYAKNNYRKNLAKITNSA